MSKFIDFLTEIAKYMGEDTTSKAIQWQFSGKFRLIARLQVAAVKDGKNPQNVDLGVSLNNTKGQKLGFFLSFSCPAQQHVFLIVTSILYLQPCQSTPLMFINRDLEDVWLR
jgi:hypothetical protein